MFVELADYFLIEPCRLGDLGSNLPLYVDKPSEKSPPTLTSGAVGGSVDRSGFDVNREFVVVTNTSLCVDCHGDL